MSNVKELRERFNEIRKVIRKWLVEQTDMSVVFAGHSDPRPDEPHVVFKLLTNLVKLGSKDETFMNKTTGLVTLRAHREFTVSIEAIGKPVGPDDELEDLVRATDILDAAHLSLDLDTVRARFDAIGLAIVDEGSVIDISQLLETETEPRALLEIVFRARFELLDNPGFFEKVQMSGEFDTDFDGVDNISTGLIEVS